MLGTDFMYGLESGVLYSPLEKTHRLLRDIYLGCDKLLENDDIHILEDEALQALWGIKKSQLYVSGLIDCKIQWDGNHRAIIETYLTELGTKIKNILDDGFCYNFLTNNNDLDETMKHYLLPLMSCHVRIVYNDRTFMVRAIQKNRKQFCNEIKNKKLRRKVLEKINQIIQNETFYDIEQNAFILAVDLLDTCKIKKYIPFTVIEQLKKTKNKTLRQTILNELVFLKISNNCTNSAIIL